MKRVLVPPTPPLPPPHPYPNPNPNPNPNLQVQTLIKANASLDLRGPDRQTALLLSLSQAQPHTSTFNSKRTPHEAVALYLLERGADIHCRVHSSKATGTGLERVCNSNLREGGQGGCTSPDPTLRPTPTLTFSLTLPL